MQWHGAQENVYTLGAVGCYADGRRGRARRITTEACANPARYVRDNTRPIQITGAPRPHPLADAHGDLALACRDRVSVAEGRSLYP